jgi:hypothetical protein
MVVDEVLQPRQVQQLGSLMDQVLLPTRVDKAVAVLDKVLGLEEMSAAYQGPSCTLVPQGKQQQQEGAVSGRKRVAQQVKSLASTASAAVQWVVPLVMRGGRVPQVVGAVGDVAASPLQQQSIVQSIDASLGLMAIWLHEAEARDKGLRGMLGHLEAAADAVRLVGVLAGGLWAFGWAFHTNLVLQPDGIRK